MANQKQTPWAILLCKFRDDLSDPPTPLETFHKLFTTEGAGTYNVVRFFNDVSHGSLDLSGSQVFGWFTLDAVSGIYTDPSDPTPPWEKRNRLIRLARNTALQAGVPLTNFFGDVVSFNIAIGGAFGGAVDSRPFACGDYRYVQDNGTQTFGQEMGHGYGLDHSRRDGSSQDYQDPWDIMSTGNAFSASDPDYRARGPGLNAANMRSRGWLDQSRVWRLSCQQGFDQIVKLRPLFRTDLSGLLAAEFPPFGQGYIVEFRVKDGWDAAIPRSAVLVHRFEGNHSYLMPGTSGELDLVERSVFELYPNLPFVQHNRVEVLDIDEDSQIATLQLSCRPAEPISTLPGNILSGVASDGGGIIFIDGRIVPVPPWDPMAQVLERLAAWRSTELVPDVGLRNLARLDVLTEISDFVQSAIEEVNSFGGPAPEFPDIVEGEQKYGAADSTGRSKYNDLREEGPY